MKPFTGIMGAIAGLALAIATSAQQSLRLEVNLSNQTCQVRWTPRVIPATGSLGVETIVPDCVLERTDTLTDWEQVLCVTGGVNTAVAPVVFCNATCDAPSHVFFRLSEQVNLPGAILRGIVLTNAFLATANLSGADLSGADLSYADLSGADLGCADLQGALTNQADLTDALLLNTIMPDGSARTDDLDAELMALELSGELVAPLALYRQLRRDLRLIRQAYPVVAPIHHLARWRVGEVLATVTPAQLQAINDSELGPVTVRSLLGSWSVLQFRLHYHPQVLAAVLRSRFGVYGAEPNYRIGDGDDITCSPISGCYTFSRGWGDCPAGCIERHYWNFAVIAGRSVLLLAEYGSPLP